jgi:hypothetical protein
MDKDLLRQYIQRLRLNNKTITASHPQNLRFRRPRRQDKVSWDRECDVSLSDSSVEIERHFWGRSWDTLNFYSHGRFQSNYYIFDGSPIQLSKSLPCIDEAKYEVRAPTRSPFQTKRPRKQVTFRKVTPQCSKGFPTLGLRWLYVLDEPGWLGSASASLRGCHDSPCRSWEGEKCRESGGREPETCNIESLRCRNRRSSIKPSC